MDYIFVCGSDKIILIDELKELFGERLIRCKWGNFMNNSMKKVVRLTVCGMRNEIIMKIKKKSVW